MKSKLWYFEQWIIGLCSVEDFKNRNFTKCQFFIPPSDRFWADPFLINYKGEKYIFFEELKYSNLMGTISCFNLKNPSKIIPVLEEKYHLSFPCIFRYEDHLYMIPETSQNNSVDLYRCETFPNNWIKFQTIFKNTVCVDSHIYRHNNIWYLSTYKKNHGLFLYYSDNPLSISWIPHPNNPITNDLKYCRPAGKMVRFQNDLYRVSQDCSSKYGLEVNFHRIEQLTKDEYIERDILNFKSYDILTHSSALHSYNQDGDLCVFDLKIIRRRTILNYYTILKRKLLRRK